MHMQSYLQNAFVIFHTQKIAIFFENDTTDNKKKWLKKWYKKRETTKYKRKNLTKEKYWKNETRAQL